MLNGRQNKNDLLKDVSLSVDLDNLTPEQQNEILSYIEFIKNKEKKPYPAETE